MIITCERCGHMPHKVGENQLSGGCDYCDLIAENARLRVSAIKYGARPVSKDGQAIGLGISVYFLDDYNRLREGKVVGISLDTITISEHPTRREDATGLWEIPPERVTLIASSGRDLQAK